MSIALPALARAPAVKRRRRAAPACPVDSPSGILAVVDVKKSIKRPTVNGILSDTLEDSRSSPIAIVKGFRSGLASAKILRKDDELPGSFAKAVGVRRDSIDGFRAGDSSFLMGVCVEYSLET
jgi:hypothetical protein